MSCSVIWLCVRVILESVCERVCVSSVCLICAVCVCVCAAGILSLLEEPELELKVFALQRLNQLVDRFWAEIAERVSKL